MVDRYVRRQSHLNQRNLRGFFTGVTSAYERRKLCCRLFLLKLALGLARAFVKILADDVAKDLRTAVVPLKPIDKGVWALIIALVVDAILQSQRWRMGMVQRVLALRVEGEKLAQDQNRPKASTLRQG
jgi:hypothetical protein